MKKIILGFTILIFISTQAACVAVREGKYRSANSARLNIPDWGILIDATYDKKLDGLVPGYKIVTVALTNRSVDTIKLDPTRDQWNIEDAWGKKQRAIISLRIRDTESWDKLPPKVKELVEYPAGVQIGYTQTFDLFFSEKVELEQFRGISFYSATLKQEFDALSNNAMDRAVRTQEPVPTEMPDKFSPPPSLKSGKKSP